MKVLDLAIDIGAPVTGIALLVLAAWHVIGANDVPAAPAIERVASIQRFAVPARPFPARTFAATRVRTTVPARRPVPTRRPVPARNAARIRKLASEKSAQRLPTIVARPVTKRSLPIARVSPPKRRSVQHRPVFRIAFRGFRVTPTLIGVTGEVAAVEPHLAGLKMRGRILVPTVAPASASPNPPVTSTPLDATLRSGTALSPGP